MSASSSTVVTPKRTRVRSPRANASSTIVASIHTTDFTTGTYGGGIASVRYCASSTVTSIAALPTATRSSTGRATVSHPPSGAPRAPGRGRRARRRAAVTTTATVAGSAGCAIRNVPARPASSPSAANQRPHASVLSAKPPARSPGELSAKPPNEEHQPLNAPCDHEVVPPEGHRGRQRQEGQRDRAVEQATRGAAPRAPAPPREPQRGRRPARARARSARRRPDGSSRMRRAAAK